MTKRNLRSKESSLGDDAEKLYEMKMRDMESVNEALKSDVEELRTKLADGSISSSVGTSHSSRVFPQKSLATKEEARSSKSKSNSHSMCSTKKHKIESSVKQFDVEVRKLNVQKVKLQCKSKLDSMHFRLLKASLEKEVLQLKKELRKSEFQKQVLSALNNRQKLIKDARISYEFRLWMLDFVQGTNPNYTSWPIFSLGYCFHTHNHGQDKKTQHYVVYIRALQEII